MWFPTLLRDRKILSGPDRPTAWTDAPSATRPGLVLSFRRRRVGQGPREPSTVVTGLDRRRRPVGVSSRENESHRSFNNQGLLKNVNIINQIGLDGLTQSRASLCRQTSDGSVVSVQSPHSCKEWETFLISFCFVLFFSSD